MRGRYKGARFWIGFVVLVVCVLGVLGYMLIADPPQKLKEPPDHQDRNGDGSSSHEDSEDSSDDRKTRPIATIGDKVITYGDFERYVVTYYSSEIIKQMLDGIVIESEAEHIGITVNDREIDEELARMQQGYASVEDFYITMEEQLGLSRQQIRQDIYHRLLLERIAIHGIHIGDEELRRYIEEHPEEFWSGTALHLQVIVTSAEDEAIRVLQQLNEGTSFKDLAAAYARNGRDLYEHHGDMGWIQADDPFVPYELMEVARRMKVGDISAPIQLTDGNHAILMLAGRKTMSADERRRLEEQIRIELALAKAMPLQDLLQQLREKWDVSVIDENFFP